MQRFKNKLHSINTLLVGNTAVGCHTGQLLTVHPVFPYIMLAVGFVSIYRDEPSVGD